jgi:hypothetical protein
MERLRQLPYDKGKAEAGLHFYTWPTYQKLRDHTDWDIRFTSEYIHEAINITDYWSMLRLGVYPHKFFTVATRSDWPAKPFANLEIVHNRVQVSSRATWIPHWTQQGLIPRDQTRQGPLNVGYCGDIKNLQISVDTFVQDLERMGCKLLLKGSDQWHDMHDIDISIAVRSLDHKLHNHKPCLKLRNAWRAGVPFIGGWDSAYTHVGEPGVDYLRVGSYDDLLGSINLLIQDSQLRTSLVSAGREKAHVWSDKHLLERWMVFFLDICFHRFYSWSSLSSFERLRALGSRGAYIGVERVVKPPLRSLRQLLDVNRHS